MPPSREPLLLRQGFGSVVCPLWASRTMSSGACASIAAWEIWKPRHVIERRWRGIFIGHVLAPVNRTDFVMDEQHGSQEASKRVAGLRLFNWRCLKRRKRRKRIGLDGG